MTRIPEGKIVFLDTEFTALSKDAELISISLCSEDRSVYLELDFDEEKASDWVKEHILPNLKLSWRFSKKDARNRILDWLEYTREGQRVIIVSDCLSYDWVLFCDLFNNQLSDFIYYIPLDLSTMFWMHGIDPDISREGFAGMDSGGKKHQADWDARVIQACFKKLMAMESSVSTGLVVNPPLDPEPVEPSPEEPVEETCPLEEVWQAAWKRIKYALHKDCQLQPSELDDLSDKIALAAQEMLIGSMATEIGLRMEEKIGEFLTPCEKQ